MSCCSVNYDDVPFGKRLFKQTIRHVIAFASFSCDDGGDHDHYHYYHLVDCDPS